MRDGVDGFEGVLYVNSRFREGVDGNAEVDAVGWRTGEPGRDGEDGATSVCRIDVKRLLACSSRTSRVSMGTDKFATDAPLTASVSDDIIGRFFEGDSGSFRLKVVRISPLRDGTKRSP